MTLWINALGYQLTWFAAVVGAAHGWTWGGALVLIVFASWQLTVSSCRGSDAMLMVLALTCGSVIDSTLLHYGFTAFSTQLPLPGFAPAWILSMWVAFSLTLNHSLRILRTHSLWLSAVLGGMAAPLAYLAAARGWDAVQFPAGQFAGVLMIGAGWSCALPLLVHAARRWRRKFASPTRTASPMKPWQKPT